MSTASLVRATGVCCACDSRFRDELVLAVRDRRMPAGVVYLELRHVLAPPFPRLSQAQPPRRRLSGLAMDRND
jgi:hypothetical protein